MEEIKERFEAFSVTKTFTTGRKPKTSINISQKHSIIYEKCKQLTEIADNLVEDHKIEDQDLKDLIELYAGADKETIRAYFGYYGHITRNNRTGEGRVIGLSRKGYLEKFGFMHRVRGIWFITYQSKLSVSNTNERVECSKEEIYLSKSEGCDRVFCQGEELEKPRLAQVSRQQTIETAESSNNNNTTEREREIFNIVLWRALLQT